jgi:hypothetical protein
VRQVSGKKSRGSFEIGSCRNGHPRLCRPSLKLQLDVIVGAEFEVGDRLRLVSEQVKE